MNTTTSHLDALDLDVTIRDLQADTLLFGRFKTKKKLGQGGMGVVWLADDTKLNVEVALKLMPQLVVLDATSIDELRGETRNCLKLAHPNVVRVIDIVQDGPSAAIVMEFINGKTLAALRIDQPNGVFEANRLTPWVEQLLDALSHAHNDAQIIHRDLKPSNLMVNEKSQLKVADFGIASSVRDSVSRVSMKSTSGASGTVPYMSPQQLMGEVSNARDDIYSLGATLYELLTSKPPFYSGDIPKQIETKVPPLVSERRRDFNIQGNPIPRAWDEVIAACLEKDPRDRPANIASVKAGLRGGKFLRGNGTTKAQHRNSSVDGGNNVPRTPISTYGLWAASLAVLAGGYYFGSVLPAQKNAAEQAKKEQAKAKTEMANSKEAEDKRGAFALEFARIKAQAPNLSSAQKQVAIWNALVSKLRAFANTNSKEASSLVAEAETELSAAQAAEKSESANYDRDLKAMQDAFDNMENLCKDKARGAAPKSRAWASLVGKLTQLDVKSDYGTQHEAIIVGAQAQAKLWSEAAAKEEQLPPADPNKCFQNGPFITLPADKQKAAIKKAETILKSSELFNGLPDENYTADTQQAIAALQRSKELPITGLLDEVTLQTMYLTVDSLALVTPPTQQTKTVIVHDNDRSPPPQQQPQASPFDNMLKGLQFFQGVKNLSR